MIHHEQMNKLIVTDLLSYASIILVVLINIILLTLYHLNFTNKHEDQRISNFLRTIFQ